jgi:hypothetical protein
MLWFGALFFNEGVAHPHTSSKLYLFYSKTKSGENKEDSSGEDTKEPKFYLT